jgi:hypothetical protein
VSDRPKSVQALLGGAALATIRAELAEQARLLGAVRECLPDFLGAHCFYCVAKGERLIIYVDSAAWSSQLRFYGPDLLDRLEQSIGYRFKEVQVRNLLSVTGASAAPSKPRLTPSAEKTIEVLRQSAENAPQELKEALQRLSRCIQAQSETGP